MNPNRLISPARLLVLFAAIASPAVAAEYFVSPRGDDAHQGTTREAALRTVQKGVNGLRPGDTLTIAPGEYHEAVTRTDLGDLAHDTLIRAELPGTVTLRGDQNAPEFRPLAGHRFVYVADFEFAGEVPAVNEIDTLTILKQMPNHAELEYIPGAFHYDRAAGKLYVSSSDFQAPTAHRYSVSTIPTHGIYLVRPRRVTISGIAVTGFSAMKLLHYRDETGGGVWGIYLVHGKDCVIRDCRAYLNAWGIGMQSGPPGCGDNVVDGCVSWGNKSQFANGDMGGITVFAARRDVIRNSTAFLNGMYGVNIYGTGGAAPNYADDGGNDEKNRSVLENNLAWGNETADIKIKTGYEYHHVARRCAAPGLWSVLNVESNLMGRAAKTDKRTPDNIVLEDETGLDLTSELADPANHDYRLQATSRFRRPSAGDADRGPFPFEANVFYVKPDGDDAADGLSIAHAWKTLRRAASGLKAGDTIYLAPGKYDANVEIKAVGSERAPVHIRGRGIDSIELRGVVRIQDSGDVKFARLTFAGGLQVERSRKLAFEHCKFSAASTALDAHDVHVMTISHCLFADFQQAAVALDRCTDVQMSGNIYDNEQGLAVRSMQPGAVRYSNYNAYRKMASPWEVAGKSKSLADVRLDQDRQSLELTPQLNRITAAGPHGKPLGPFRDTERTKMMRLVAGPELHSTSATTANLEWTTSLPATCRLAWGETAECEHQAEFNVNCSGTYSLTGLKPGTKYFFKIKSIETPRDILPKTTVQQVFVVDAPPLEFTTPAMSAPPATYYVANDGDDAHSGLSRNEAWKTIRHAAAHVNAGDTVLIAGGTYRERVRMRATGDIGRPITFRSLPGERVRLDGSDMSLNSAIVAAGKSHLRFDGLYFANFNLFPNDSWSLLNSGEFQLYQGRDIEISRCFSEGRGGYSALPVAAYHVADLKIKNCVNTFKFGGMYFWRCPNLVVENTVFAGPMIMAYVLRNEKDQSAMMRNCIFTDMLDKKARINLGLLCCDGAMDSVRNQNNCYLLRDCIPLAERAMDGTKTLAQLERHILEPLFADPQFAGLPPAKSTTGKPDFAPDRMMDAALPLDFDSFFATNPELQRRGIGLEPEAFKDFRFENSSKE